MRGMAVRLAVFAALAVFILLPLVQTFVLSFMNTLPRDGMAEGEFTWLNYRNIWAEPALRESILNSMLYVSLNVALCLGAGLPAAYALSRYSFVGDRHFLFLMLAFRVTPPVVLSLPIFILFAEVGLVNTPVGIALVHCLFNLPIAIWILESFISAVPKEFDETSVSDAFAALGWDAIDLLVNNAGIAGPATGPVETLALADWRRMIDTHLTGAFLMTRAAVPRLRDGGSIVNIASTRAFMSEPETEAYAAAKGGLVALTHALAVSLGPRLRVNAIAPGWVTTESLRPEDHAQHPAGRAGRPDDIADAVLYLSQAGFVTGQTLVIDGGMTRKMIYEE